MENETSVIRALNLRQHDGLLMSARIEESTKSLFSELENFIKSISDDYSYKSSTENNGCIIFSHKGKTCTSRFYEPDLIELDFDFREIITDADFFTVLELLEKIASILDITIEVEAEGDKNPFAIVTSLGVKYNYNTNKNNHSNKV